MSDKIYQVTAQGVAQDLTKATGGYDDVIEYGVISVEELKKIWRQFIRIKPFTPFGDEDYCPANVKIEGPYGSYLLKIKPRP